MAASVESPSPSHLTKERVGLMVSSPPSSPASDEGLWSALRGRVDAILENRNRKVLDSQNQDRAKRRKEDSQLLLRGFDSIAHTLSQLSNNLDNALQGARHLAEPPTLREIFHSKLVNSEINEEDLDKERQNEEEEKKGLKRKLDPTESSDDQGNEQSPKDRKLLNRAKNIAISMATKAASLARELKSIKSDLCFMQERSGLLEEENRRLRDGLDKGIRPEEDDLMRLQMEALLAEKSRLANENANLVRENQCLHQLVEYHQLTSHDLSESYEQVLRGMCLDFSSPPPSILEEAENEGEAQTTRTSSFGFCNSLDDCFRQEQQQQEVLE